VRRIVLSLVVAMGLLVPVRPSVAAAPAEAQAETQANPKVAELQAMHGEAQQRVERYNATLDASHLTTARELLTRWLVEHRALYGDTAEAKSVRAPIEQQLGAIDAELARVGGSTTAVPVVVMPVGPAAVAGPGDSPPPRPTYAHHAAMRRAQSLVRTGVGTTAVGGLTLLAASLPLWMLRNRALRRANEETFYVDEQRLVSRARRRQAGSIATFAVGTTLVGAGVALITVGAIKQLRLRRELAVVPEFGRGFAGASATLRF
jgi:hypothetical protein